MRVNTSIALAATFLFVGLGLGYTNYVMWSHPVDIGAVRLEGDDARTEVSPHSVGEVGWTDNLSIGQALERPLFYPNRREYTAMSPKIQNEPVPEPIAEAITEQPSPDIRLIGTRLLNGTRSALVESSGSEPTWLEVGDISSIWTVAAVTNTKLVLSHGRQSIEFELYHD